MKCICDFAISLIEETKSTILLVMISKNYTPLQAQAVGVYESKSR
jgi:hypothetical protein